MNIYLIGIIIFSLVLIISIFIYIYFLKDEKKLVEVSNKQLLNYGKNYSKTEFEDKIFEIYTNILMNKMDENYAYLKDILSDEEYNKFLIEMKNNKDNNVQNVVKNIEKEFSKLISFQIINDLEVAKLWVRYSAVEYTKGFKKIIEDGNQVLSEVVISGDANNKNNYEYILTFVKNKSNSEDIVCPSCGYQTHMLVSSKCLRCDNEIVPKKMHWVYVGKVVTNISKEK